MAIMAQRQGKLERKQAKRHRKAREAFRRRRGCLVCGRELRSWDEQAPVPDGTKDRPFEICEVCSSLPDAELEALAWSRGIVLGPRS